MNCCLLFVDQQASGTTDRKPVSCPTGGFALVSPNMSLLLCVVVCCCCCCCCCCCVMFVVVVVVVV